jgi:hypothetical protein
VINPDLNIHLKHDNLKKIAEVMSKLDRADEINTVDWWEDDLVGVGFIKKNNIQKSVYVFAKNMPEDRYKYECDVYHSDDPADHTTMHESEDASLEETVKRIEEFLLED